MANAVDLRQDSTGFDNSITTHESLQVMSYNVDGLNCNDLKLRTHACIDIILDQSADVVTLQEVVPETRVLFCARLREVYSDQSGIDSTCANYFTMIFVKKTRVCLRNLRCPFKHSRSQMGRDVLKAFVRIGDCTVCIITSHLESTQSCSSTRCKQLREIFDSHLINSRDPTLFCGDTNLSFNRMKGKLDEVLSLGYENLAKIDDAYEASGAKNAGGLSSTWRRRIPTGKTVQCRFDRFFSNKQCISVRNMSDGGFVLVGRDPLAGVVNSEASGYDTPSDHFGVVVTYDINTLCPLLPSIVSTANKDKCVGTTLSSEGECCNPKSVHVNTATLQPDLEVSTTSSELSQADIRAKRLKYFTEGIRASQRTAIIDSTTMNTALRCQEAQAGNVHNFAVDTAMAKTKGVCTESTRANSKRKRNDRVMILGNESSHVLTQGPAEMQRARTHFVWTCHACTFDHSDGQLPRCAMCQTARRGSIIGDVITIE